MSKITPTKEQMYQWYEIEKKSYRQIMELTEIKNNRLIPKLLNEYGIVIRKGSEAVKAQWHNNDKRKKEQGEYMSALYTGRANPSKMLTDEEIKNRVEALSNIKFIKRELVNKISVIYVKCDLCEYEYRMDLSALYGCAKCARIKQGERQRTPFQEVIEFFNDTKWVLMDDDTNYNGILSKVKYICSEHAFLGEQEQHLYSLKKHSACKMCRLNSHRERKGLNLKERERIKPLLNEWRLAVFKRDSFTCQCCGYDKGKILRAHHLKNFAEHPHLRLDIDNGVTLCSYCHDLQIKGSFHHTYGTRRNTLEQLEEYINLKREAAH